MSDEKTASEKEPAAVEGYFESLIEDFGAEDNTEEAPAADMRNFSKFFDDAKEFGSGFQSTIDKPPEELSEGTGEDISFTGEDGTEAAEPRELITEPITDEDGMIVIFDEEAGIDATGEGSESGSKGSEGGEGGGEDKADKDAADDDKRFEADSNIPADDEDEPEPAEETAPEEKEPKKKKRPILGGLIPRKGDSVGEVIRKIIFIASTAVFIYAAVMLISTLIQSEEMQEEVESIAKMVTTTVATTINSAGEVITIPPTTEQRVEHNSSVMNSFMEVSSDVKGFLELPGCGIHLPVVQAGDNKYYLTHTYDDRKNKAGAIFMDYRCVITEDYTSPNIVLYGHNQEDGTMFGKLKNYKNNVEFYKQNPTVEFNTEYGLGDYIIFAYFIANIYESQDTKGEVFHYHDYIETLNNESTFNWYMTKVNERNQIIPPIDVVFGDKLLVLSTCSNEYSDSRFVVIARKVREGENIADINFGSAALNPNAREIDWNAILSLTEESTESETTTETTTEPTTTTTTEETTTTTTTESETTTTETTAPTIPENFLIISKLSLAPPVINGTTHPFFGTTAPTESVEEDGTSVPEGEESSDTDSVTETAH